MAINYVRMQALAKRLIEGNGRSVTLVSDSTTPADVNAPQLGPDFSLGKVEEPVIAAFVPKAGSEFGISIAQLLNNELIQGFEQVALVAATSLSGANAIGVFDRLRDGATMWKIKNIEILQPGSLAILYQLGLSR